MELSFNGDFEVGIPRDETFVLLADPQKFLPVLPTFHSMQMKQDEANTAIVNAIEYFCIHFMVVLLFGGLGSASDFHRLEHQGVGDRRNIDMARGAGEDGQEQRAEECTRQAGRQRQ